MRRIVLSPPSADGVRHFRRTLAGELIADRTLTHVYSLVDGLVAAMDIRE
jgi:hypothetical protein